LSEVYDPQVMRCCGFRTWKTVKLNGINPQAWLADTLARIPDYKINHVDDLLPWKTAL